MVFLAVLMNKKEEFGTRVVPNSILLVLGANGPKNWKGRLVDAIDFHGIGRCQSSVFLLS